MSKIIILLASVIFAGLVVIQPSNKSNQDKEPNMQSSPQPTTETKQLEKPELQIDQSKTYTATLQTTKGNIVIELDTNNTPIATNNFVYLAENDFYNNTIFHRVMKGFMIQGGDPTGTGSGGPGYKFEDEEFEGEYTRGTVAMANSGPDTNGSQFFIMHQDYDLPKNYVIFGEVIEGMNVVDQIATTEVTQSPTGENSKPVNPVKVKSVKISKK